MNIGDRVKFVLTKDGHFDGLVGNTGTVTAIFGDVVYVDWDIMLTRRSTGTKTYVLGVMSSWLKPLDNPVDNTINYVTYSQEAVEDLARFVEGCTSQGMVVTAPTGREFATAAGLLGCLMEILHQDDNSLDTIG